MTSNIVERILGKIVGHEVSMEEMELISGGVDKGCKLDEMQTGHNNGPTTCDR
jgi:hypothetical protein